MAERQDRSAATAGAGAPAPRTLLVGLAHPDDELNVAGTILAQRARGDHVVILFLTRGEMTESFGPLSTEEVARRRIEQGTRAAGILGAEVRFLDYPDTELMATPTAAARVARLLTEIRPDALVTWGDAWIRGMCHPDHEACGKIFRDAITLARVAKVVAPADPHRAPAPLFTLRGAHSALPLAAVDVEPYLATIHELARFYRQSVGFGDAAWIDRRLTAAGAAAGFRYAELFDAWETQPGRFGALLPAEPLQPSHPDWRTRHQEGEEGGEPR